MRSGYVLLAVLAALLIGFAIGALTGGDDSDEPETTRTESVAGDTTGDSDTRGDSSPGDSTPGTDDQQGTERAPESANDPRPEAPDDVIGDRPGAGGDEDDGR